MKAGSLRGQRVSIAVISLVALAGGTIWLLVGVVAGNPGGIDGPGFLKGSFGCPVRGVNYAFGLSGVVSGGLLALLAGIWGLGIAFTVNLDQTQRAWGRLVMILIVCSLTWAALVGQTSLSCPS